MWYKKVTFILNEPASEIPYSLSFTTGMLTSTGRKVLIMKKFVKTLLIFWKTLHPGRMGSGEVWRHPREALERLGIRNVPCRVWYIAMRKVVDWLLSRAILATCMWRFTYNATYTSTSATGIFLGEKIVCLSGMDAPVTQEGWDPYDVPFRHYFASWRMFLWSTIL